MKNMESNFSQNQNKLHIQKQFLKTTNSKYSTIIVSQKAEKQMSKKYKLEITHLTSHRNINKFSAWFFLWCFAGFDQSWCTIYHMWLGLHLFYQEFPFQGIITKWCKLLRKISLPVSREQASKQLDSSFLFSYFLILSSFSGSNLSKISCTFHFGQMLLDS